MFVLLTSGWWSAALAVFTAAIGYIYSTSTYGYWRKRNVPHARPVVPLFGNLLPLFLSTEHQTRLYSRLYNGFHGNKYGGIFQMRTPYLMVCDPELVTQVLIKDFAHFTDHGVYRTDPRENPLANGLFTMNGAQWKVMRQKLSPAFTSGRLKLMHGQIRECSDQLMRNVADRLKESGGRMEIFDVFGKYSTDVIGTCGYGLQLNTVKDENSEFRKHGKVLFRPSLWMLLKDLVWMISPSLRTVLKIKDFPQSSIDFFTAVFTDAMKYRRDNGLTRNDIMQTLIQARTDLIVNKLEPSVEFEETDIIANAFILFAAAFETVSITMSFCLYELALKKHIQDRVREEMINTKSKHNGELSNDYLMDLHYLEMVLSETLRKYPPLVILFREATKDYQVPDDHLVIKKGTKVIIPAYALQHDHRYFPDPETFDPERFTPEAKSKRPSGTYMPFGDGPRLCIGKRFAETEMKLALTEILTNYEVEPCEKTDIPIKLSAQSFIVIPENGVWLKFKPIRT